MIFCHVLPIILSKIDCWFAIILRVVCSMYKNTIRSNSAIALTLELPRGGVVTTLLCFLNAIFFRAHFQKRFRTPLGYSLLHLLVHKLKKTFAPR